MLRELVPWWARIGAKLVLSRLPAGYAHWRKLNLFAHGSMDRSDYVLGVFRQHFAHAEDLRHREFVALEIGPGDSVSSALVARAHGATRVHLVDAGMYATQDMNVYRSMIGQLRSQGLQTPSLDRALTLDDVLAACNATYGVRGLQSMRDIPSESVDFVWSHAVLEHIRRDEFATFAREMRRVLRPHGLCSHEVDLKDHLGGALNNLRIPSRWWEAEWMARSGFYTNRLRMSQMLQLFDSAGFKASIIATHRWPTPPIPRHALAREFQDLDAGELTVCEFQVVLRPA